MAKNSLVPSLCYFVVLFVLVVLHFGASSEGHECIHDEIMAKYPVVRLDPSLDPSIRSERASKRNWSSIRIKLFYDLTLTSEKASFLQNKLLPQAIGWLQSALSVVPLDQPIVVPFSTCGEASVPSAHRTSGVSDADYVLYINSNPKAGNTLAYAGACLVDNTYRPIGGFANFVPDYVVPSDIGSEKFNYQLNTAIHELFHALGFSSNFFSHFTDSQGLPYSTVIQQFSERGHSVMKMVTPRVKQYAGQHFNCPSINGVEIEDQGGSGTAGSHWEQRVYNNEFMTGVQVQGSVNAKSAISLAAMEDSGWYRANYSAAQPHYWGKGKGCSFVTGSCLAAGSTPQSAYPDHFCTVPQAVACGVGRQTKGLCAIATYSQALPSYEQYFTGAPTKGGSLQTADFCPIYMPFNTDGGRTSNCLEPTNQPATNYWGESYGPKALCFSSSIVDSRYTSYLVNPGATCHQQKCEGGALKVLVGSSWISCPAAGGEINVSGFRGHFTCPAYSELC